MSLFLEWQLVNLGRQLCNEPEASREVNVLLVVVVPSWLFLLASQHVIS